VIAITEKSRCAVRALVHLSRLSERGPVPILEIAEATDVPVHFLEQVFASLRRSGVLQSQRGVKGGYSFRREPEDISVLEVVEAVDGAMGGPSPRGGDDATRAIWNDVRQKVAETLGEMSIADVKERDERTRDAPMFHI
jgi:Rrf2 family transcriptional regulator, cysteine metabolism repressor